MFFDKACRNLSNSSKNLAVLSCFFRLSVISFFHNLSREASQGETHGKDPREWLRQADYDMDPANFMFSGGRYFYAVFMCHLSIEKALKGLYHERLKEIPPKVHNLVYLLNKMGVKPPEAVGKFFVKLNEAHVVTRYPEGIEKLQRDYTQAVTKDIITKSAEALEWIKRQF